MKGAPRILLIRRDNIGDLVCTTPLFRALRDRFPDAYLCALVTSYNRAVLDHHPALDRVVTYTKAKHLEPGESLVGCYVDRIRTLIGLRREKFDYCILAAPGFQQRALLLARWVGARHVVGFVESRGRSPALIDRSVPWHFDAALTETEDVWGLVRAFGIGGEPGRLEVFPDVDLVAPMSASAAAIRQRGRRLVGIHLSARKPSQRWPAQRFAELMHCLNREHGCTFMLLWAPGSADNPRHPGDDAKATGVLSSIDSLPVLAMPTPSLESLIAAISLCDDFICADGGAMHIAAALSKPIVCMFGASDAVRWRPWGVPFRLLQNENRDVATIDAEAVSRAYGSLREELRYI